MTLNYQLLAIANLGAQILLHQQQLGLSDSEIFTITIVERVVFTIMNTIMTVDLLTISIHNTKIKHGFLNFYELSQF